MVTVDDQLGDSLTGELPVYTPPDRWTQGAVCSVCLARADPAKAFNGTWHDSTVFGLDPNITETNVTIKFTGPTIQAYCILANSADANVSTLTQLTFSIDGAYVGSYYHPSTSSGEYMYDVMVYGNDSVSGDGVHTFVIHLPKVPETSVVLFDYARYADPSVNNITSSTRPLTSSAPTPFSTPSSGSGPRTGAIAGGVIGGFLVIIVALLVIIIFFRRRREKATGLPNAITPWNPDLSLAQPEPGQKGRRMKAGPASEFLPSHPSGVTSDGSDLMRQIDDHERRLTQLRNDVRGQEAVLSGTFSTAPPAQISDQSMEARMEALQRDMDGLRELFLSISPTSPPSYAHA